jgi:hypothetical protein
MSLLICSSAQDKYESKSNMVVADVNGNLLPVTSEAIGLQNPNSFTNNINPVMEIPAHSQVALKDISFSKRSMFKVGNNVSFSLYIGELLEAMWSSDPERSLYETTSMPYPVPLQPGTYNERTFANMINQGINDYIGYPDAFKRVFVEPASTHEDGTNTKGYIFNFDKGYTENRPTDKSAKMPTAIRHDELSLDFTWNGTTKTYTATEDDFETNEGILTDIPLSLNNGRVIWDVSGATGGFRVGLIRPSLEDGREMPSGFNSAYGDAQLGTFMDICVEYDQRTDSVYNDAAKTLRIYHAVVQDGIKCMREVEYYNNAAGDFDPPLNSYLPAKGAMFRTTPTTRTDIGGDPTTIKIIACGEDTAVLYTFGGTDYVLTDSRLCIAANVVATPASVAGVPTRNRFIKPTGINNWAMYPIMSLKTDTEAIVLDEWTGISQSEQSGYKYPAPATLAAGNNAPAASGSGGATAGHSFYGRARLSNNMGQADISNLADTAKPYDSSNADVQKQYVGVAGPTGATPPVRIGEGNPRIPDPATETGTVAANSFAMILIPPAESVGDWKTDGLYACSTSDVSEMFGFSNTTMVAQSRQGNSYLYANAPTAAALLPTDTEGAFFGWYLPSKTDPIYANGPLFVRCPTLTHQSYNFGKGIPSKIIASLPADSFSRDVSSGFSYYAPSEMTYLDLKNPAPLNFNDITLEIVDKMEEVVEVLDKSTTITLHFKSK